MTEDPEEITITTEDLAVGQVVTVVTLPSYWAGDQTIHGQVTAIAEAAVTMREALDDMIHYLPFADIETIHVQPETVLAAGITAGEEAAIPEAGIKDFVAFWLERAVESLSQTAPGESPEPVELPLEGELPAEAMAAAVMTIVLVAQEGGMTPETLATMLIEMMALDIDIDAVTETEDQAEHGE